LGEGNAVTPAGPRCDEIDILRPLEELEEMTAEELLAELHRLEEWLDFVMDEMKMLARFLRRKTKTMESA
jgi:hypothetical protein